MTTHEKIALYHQLDSRIKIMQEKRDELNKQIKEEIVSDAELHPGQTVESDWGPYRVTLTAKRRRLPIDDGALAQLLVDKNLWASGTSRRVDHDLVEQLFIEGKLTDSDLRSISIEGSEITFALKVGLNDV